jgi:hypothetical protein
MSKFQKGQSGNSRSRAKRSRNEKLFGEDQRAAAIIGKAIELAASGDAACMRLCLD